jgi:DNA polymerase-3 subunit gamma/tau
VSYQVLARKYRPANFEELAGQEHVLRALVNSLETNRLHHAYLFTGTRGVGKTTIARILAKCLNCDKGVTATPCGTCGSCLEIAEGRSVDLIEVDAASRTRVEETRELLDNVQYMPTKSRFKIYLIDEVHMFSNHSFNALLKTLEEPPEHVKFLLATTDPKKLPITVLSRCLQFNLKNLSPERIVSYLQEILPKESIGYEDAALWHLGRAADGSMRDALSLTDQAISFGESQINEVDVKAMLGSIDRGEVYRLIDALVERDGKQLLDRIEHLAEFSPDYSALLGEFLSVLHRVAVAQAVPEGIDNSQGDRDIVLAIAQHISPEDIQLYYQIGLLGQKDLPYAPDQRSGFEMTLLRMLSFMPNVPPLRLKTKDPAGQVSPSPETPAENDTQIPFDDVVAAPTVNASTSLMQAEKANLKALLDPKVLDEAVPQAPKSGNTRSGGTLPGNTTPEMQEPENAIATPAVEPAEGSSDISAEGSKPAEGSSDISAEGSPITEPVATSGLDADGSENSSSPLKFSDETGEELTQSQWITIFPDLGLTGVTQTLAANCTIGERDGNASSCTLLLNQHHASMWNKTHEVRIAMALSTFLGHTIVVKIEIGESNSESPAEAAQRGADEALASAVVSIENDENVQELIQNFDGTLVKESIVAKAQDLP